MIHGQTVDQPLPSLLLSEGDPLHINCTFKVSGTPYLYWYTHYHSRAPEMLLYNFGLKENRGFTAQHDKEKSTFHLTKAKAELSDSGVYYCAVSDTVIKIYVAPVSNLCVTGAKFLLHPKAYRMFT
ncbi:unnamed protein product [Staurois parvus]|uniref:Ig-like domain-containing protein n=1 Tax=Staurois parvus TaxID=386267 RepID=A0ABN9H0H3_9NEOB|nr:unnamed protein product [Staurois parvus]